MSGYYTSVKGDLYLALRGYQGQITFTDSNSDGIYEINGDPLIEVTGTIKFAINYSPMVNTGTQVLPTDVDRLITALGNYIANGNGIVVLPNTSADISGYENGQMFYVKSEKALYTKSSGSLSFYSKSLQVYPYSAYGISNTTTLANLYDMIGGEPCLFEYTSGHIWYFGRLQQQGSSYFFEFENPLGVQRYAGVSVAGTTTLSTIFAPSSEYSKPYATQDDLSSAISTEDTALKTYVANHYAKKCPFSEYGITKTTTLIDLYAIIGEEPAIIEYKYSNSVYEWYVCKLTKTGSVDYSFEFENTENDNRFVGNATGYNQLQTLLDISSQLYFKPYATKKYVDDKIADFMQKEYQEVNTTTYPTLDDFLASTGTEGYIYLYPTGQANDYYRYIWENNAWVNLGTTQMDLADYVQKTTTIAGIDLQDNITSQELTDALVLTDTTDDVDYIMGVE